MKHAKKIIIACWVVVFASLAGLTVWLLTGNLFGVKTDFNLFSNPNINISTSFEKLPGTFSQVGEYSISADSIDSIDVDWVSGSVDIVPYEGNTIKLVEYAQRELKDGESLITVVEGKTLKITDFKSQIIRKAPLKKLELFVPEQLASKFDQLEIDTASADLSVKGLSLSLLEIDSASGSIGLSNMFVADSIDIDSVSNDIVLKNTAAALIDIETASGNISIEGRLGKVSVDTVSGNTEISSTSVADMIDVDTASGDIKVFVPADSDISVSHSSASGSFNSELPVRMVKDKAKFNFDTVSGDVEIWSIK